MRSLPILCAGLLAVGPCGELVAQDVDHGAEDYKLCASCHGFRGEGSQLVNAPALAGQSAWYLERQIQNFRSGVRGGVETDTHGKVMATMAKGLDSDEKVADIVAYIGTLPAANPKATIAGDVDKGRALYASCAACHGERAEGNAQLNGPALAATEDWYQLRQLELFKRGERGANPEDTYGQQMRPMASVLTDDAAMRDVVAYIATLD